MNYTFFHFMRRNKSHIHFKNLNILYIIVLNKGSYVIGYKDSFENICQDFFFFLARLSRRLKVSFSDPLLSVVCQHLPCEQDTGHIMHPIIMKICQNVCLDEIWVKFENESCWVKN